MTRYRCCLLAIAALALLARPAVTQPGDLPRLETHEAEIQVLMRKTTLDVDDPLAVFAFVFDSLPERVKVYPTENYYYFNFVHSGKSYDGNIRLDASDRDQGKVNFGYSEDLKEWLDETPVKFMLLDAGKGVAVEKLEPLVYRVTYRGKSVTFTLNDLSAVKPPPGAIGADETYIGPIFDDSAIRFFLVYNRKLKIFHYILDETVDNAEDLVQSHGTDRLLIGRRSGFAFYRDHKLPRKILVGVFEANIRVNNHYDGPFDQLPDNFIEGETLRNAILEVAPELKGKIDRFGGSADGARRYAIDPYLAYRSEKDLRPVHDCAVKEQRSARYYNCFVADYQENGRIHMRIKSLAKGSGRSQKTDWPQ
jgi:hypothetical protein